MLLALVGAQLSFGVGQAGSGTPTTVLTTQASPSGFAVGVPIFDFATLGLGNNPTGSITFNLYGPDNATCAGPPIFVSNIAVSGNGNYQSDFFGTTQAGTYQWTAAYSGDANNSPAFTVCNDPAEQTLVTRRISTFSTAANPPTPGNQITDTGTISGGVGPVGPTGTITFDLFGPDNLVCSGPPIFTSTKVVAGNGSYTSDPFTATTPGTYQWLATYSGDANNTPAFTICADPAESVVVTSVGPVTPTIVTTASPGVTLGGQVSDTANLTGGNAPTGTITFDLYGPDDPTCANAPVFTSNKPVSGNGSYTSDAFTPTAAGTYSWRAAYSGDAGNNAVSTACNDPNETVVVTPVVPTIDVAKDANPLSLPQPGGVFTFNVQVVNPSLENMTITSLVDNVYGDLSTQGTCVTALGTVLLPSQSYTCSFTGSFTGPTGATQTDIVTVTATNAAGATATDSDDATVSISAPVVPTIDVAKDANPLSLPQPGGVFTFNVQVVNPSLENMTITSLVDNVYGDLSTQGTCVTALGTVLLPSQSYTCSFTGSFTGPTGATQTDIVTVTATNAAGATATDSDDATVSISALPTPTLATVASPGVQLGGQVSDTATITGGNSPTGLITFSLFGPDDATCSGAPVSGSFTTVVGNGSYTSDPFTPTAAGTYRWRVAYSGDAGNNAVSTACNDPNESVIVTGAVTPTLTTTASPNVTLGGQVSDTGTLGGGSAPTGSITFTLFGPDDATCSGGAVFMNTKPVSGNGNYSSDTFTPTLAGTYRWRAAYSGDANNSPVTTPCNDPNETVVVTPVVPVTPTITTTASPDVALGGQVSDTASLAGGSAPTGTITFTLYGPDDATCAGAAAFTSTKPVAGNGSYTADQFTPTAAGFYRWRAAYSGDANNNPVSTACNDPSESVVVTAVGPVTPTISTTASPGVTLGGQVTDTATLAGGSAPTGTITFTLYGPDDATCAGAAAFTSTKTVAGNGAYISDPFTPVAAGTYRWRAAYSGDANNNPVSTACNDPNESVVVTAVVPVTPTISTTASAGVTLGGSVTDTAALSGGNAPTGTITFTSYGPDDATCAGAAAFSSTKAVAGNGSYGSDPFTPTAAGTYRWRAAYSGDAGNNPVSTACNDPNESVVVTAPVDPTISVEVTVTPLSLPEPGGDFTYTVKITNTTPTAHPLTITSIVDDVYGDLATRPGSTCGALIGTVVQSGQSVTCSYVATFTGQAGATLTHSVTVVAEGSTATATVPTTITITDALPSIDVGHDVTPLSRPAPGGSFTHSVTVRNTSAGDPVTVSAIADDVFAGVATAPGSTCGAMIGTVLQPGASTSCTFVTEVTGTAGSTRTDVVTVSAVDDEGNSTSDAAAATVTITEPSGGDGGGGQPVPPGAPSAVAQAPPRSGALVVTGADALSLLGVAALAIVFGALLVRGRGSAVGVRGRRHRGGAGMP